MNIEEIARRLRVTLATGSPDRPAIQAAIDQIERDARGLDPRPRYELEPPDVESPQ